MFLCVMCDGRRKRNAESKDFLKPDMQMHLRSLSYFIFERQGRLFERHASKQSLSLMRMTLAKILRSCQYDMVAATGLSDQLLDKL